MRRVIPVAFLVALFVVALVSATPAMAKDNHPCKALPLDKVVRMQTPGGFSTYADNENNAHTGTADGDMGGNFPPCIYNDDPIHPIEFNINIGGSVPSSMTLSVLAGDVDFPDENDEVYINGHLLGVLNGADSVISGTSFTVPGAYLVAGNNLIEIQVDTLNPGDAYWCAYIYGAELLGPQAAIPAASHTGLLILAGLIALAAIAILVKIKL